jgi:hypothetical protein
MPCAVLASRQGQKGRRRDLWVQLKDNGSQGVQTGHAQAGKRVMMTELGCTSHHHVDSCCITDVLEIQPTSAGCHYPDTGSTLVVILMCLMN